MIDAPGWTVGGGTVDGVNAGGYTTVAYEMGVGKGITFTPAKGDTSKRLFIPAAGWYSELGYYIGYGSGCNLWATTQYSASQTWHLGYDEDNSGVILAVGKLISISLRCVRS